MLQFVVLYLAFYYCMYSFVEHYLLAHEYNSFSYRIVGVAKLQSLNVVSLSLFAGEYYFFPKILASYCMYNYSKNIC